MAACPTTYPKLGRKPCRPISMQTESPTTLGTMMKHFAMHCLTAQVMLSEKKNEWLIETRTGFGLSPSVTK